MNSFVKLIVFSCVIVWISAAALSDDIYQGDIIDDDNEMSYEPIIDQVDPGSDVVRPRRLSCDLFQRLFPKHSVCASRCMKGGTCQNGVCYCHGPWFGK